MNAKHVWGGHIFMRVSKKRYQNFIKFFRDKIEGNDFMGWYDSYDWSLNPGFDFEKATDEERWDNLEQCMVARLYFEDPKMEYWLRLDYIANNNYDINTVIPTPRKKRLTKKQKMLEEAFCEAFDQLFITEAKKEM